MFYYEWTASFEDGTVITQPQDDKYSKHDDTRECNPSSFQDILDKLEESPLVGFSIKSVDGVYSHHLDMLTRVFTINGSDVFMERPNENLQDIKLIYYRTMEQRPDEEAPRVVSYNYGYFGKDANGRNVEKVVTVYG